MCAFSARRCLAVTILFLSQLHLASLAAYLPVGTAHHPTYSNQEQFLEVCPVSITISNFHESLPMWEGWGTSLCWWANAIGFYEDLVPSLSNLLFDQNLSSPSPAIFKSNGLDLPKLGLNIVRYNIGGSRARDDENMETSGAYVPWFRRIQGFRPTREGPFDFTKDPWQQRVLMEALKNGVDRINYFSNAVSLTSDDVKNHLIR
jgi:hypothetical protein